MFFDWEDDECREREEKIDPVSSKETCNWMTKGYSNSLIRIPVVCFFSMLGDPRKLDLWWYVHSWKWSWSRGEVGRNGINWQDSKFASLGLLRWLSFLPISTTEIVGSNETDFGSSGFLETFQVSIDGGSSERSKWYDWHVMCHFVQWCGDLRNFGTTEC